ncbi:TspO/MBR family protein [Streptomyces sp. NPDC058874]|uniref:TspO/MBR family protein n=1 Tax=unclassified Streptomyces TaxID=2593676 RepID=UPI003696D38C
MRLISEGDRAGRLELWRAYACTAAAVAATAAAGAKAVDADSSWYRALNKPSWQPPPAAFPVVWTPLYASIAFAGGRALGRARGRARARLAGSLAVNLALNAGWTWVFFRLRSPKAALVGTLLLDVSNADLIRRTARADAAAAAALIPYGAWCGFATWLNAAVVRRNPHH